MEFTPKQKAEILINRFYLATDEDGFHSSNIFRAKQCALIAIDEMLEYIDHKSMTGMFLGLVKYEIKL